jgi:hypothetical protein
LAVTGSAGEELQIGVLRSDRPYQATNGSFTYRIGLDLPPFHGIEPDLSLSYNSSRKQRGGGRDQGWLGVGWVMGDLDVIERGTARGGVPHYDSADTYFWNGEPLLPCVTGSPGPSCAFGGTHFSKVETFRRFFYAPTLNTWTIVDPLGVKRVLQPLGTYFATPTSDPVEQKHRRQYRWVLDRIEDTHANIVSLDYTCLVAPQCELKSVSYTGTLVEFFWETRLDVVSYGTGAGIRRADKRLRSVKVTHGGAVQKAFALLYDVNAVTLASLLREVVPYGRDAVVTTAGAITGGSALPSHRFEYSRAATAFTWGPAVGWSASSQRERFVADVNGDGKDDLVKPFSSGVGAQWYNAHTAGIATLYSGTNPATNAIRRMFAGHFNADKAIDFVHMFWSLRPPQDCDTSCGGEPMYDTETQYFISNGAGGFNGSVPSGLVSPALSRFELNTYRVEDADGDGIELIRGSSQLDLGVDFDGDGRADRISGSSINYSGGGSTPVPEPDCIEGDGYCVVADVNGDGLTDFIEVEGAGPITVKVSLSTGAAFAAPLVESGITGRPAGVAAADVNGDGRAELIVGTATAAGSDGVAAYVLLLRDNDIVPQTAWTLTSLGIEDEGFTTTGAASQVGDFNGDASPT